MDLEVTNKLQKANIHFLENVSLRDKTWIRRGPIVPLYVIPEDAEELENCIIILHNASVNFKLVGHTSNLYFLDTYQIDAIISTIKLTKVIYTDDYIECETGVSISRLSKICVEKGFLGFEGLVDLPGTVGAAFINNSSCYKCSVSQLVINAKALVLQEDGTLVKKVITYDDMYFTRRSSAVKRGELHAFILCLKLKIIKTNDINQLVTTMHNIINHRKFTQEGKANNLGSIYSSLASKPLGVFDLGLIRVPSVILYKLFSHFFGNMHFFKIRWSSILLRLYGYNDLRSYVSSKNINCFIWKDKYADAAFVRYEEFMKKCFECGTMEIEICK